MAAQHLKAQITFFFFLVHNTQIIKVKPPIKSYNILEVNIFQLSSITSLTLMNSYMLKLRVLGEFFFGVLWERFLCHQEMVVAFI